ncbi:alanine--tRNA ligase [Listeria booriae]|uniref:Alanine--tRNA ligase n=1 Tax=Listeria booriae TaxID=1552123 RepID=A0A842AAM9_9LIST|nr:alanine--tRNA ligase [Listeria booriae]MBC1401753.1 alanine--tRNA ligase [Listeria booriae]MBC1614999.1 alanine--tRNA ligase [Listeria booriae]MBC1888474.1 alanine--tRNA ligase [Listeria booriae]MBC1897723.1 alanine--tRNA ligase [Listeria booriae]MBC1913178.1 alanine--tRNA ligase [Listeria booriae]
MKQLSSAEVRQMFLDFFQEKGHQVEPSAPLVPINDASLLWINSGVATLKKYFDGSVIPDNPRITNAQKSIRTNDIENVGKTARHHTFFEMLGNFSIGEYFKEEAIVWAWEFLTSPKWIGFDPDKLYVTVYPEDEEAKTIWKEKVGLTDDHIVPIEDNFWDIGEGPSGPDSEIFYDRGEAYGNDPTDPELYPGGENERYLEIWNLVFSQFNHNADGTYTPLPKKNIDTGMGLERMVSIIQDAPTNFETDLFMPIIREVEAISGEKYGQNPETDTAFKVIADHIRTVAFAIGDSALPSNEGRGYVLRRLLRRAVRYAKNININEPFMYKLVPVVGQIMNSYYPEVEKQTEFIQKIIRTEEERFHETLNEGLAILEEMMAAAKESGQMSGADIFKLYDTFGFPVELTEEYAEDNGLTVDHAGFEEEMNKQRDRARNARADVKSMSVQTELLTSLTEKSTFVGYEATTIATEVLYIIKAGSLAESASRGEKAQVIFKETPFYAESGGQVADHGIITKAGFTATVLNVQKAPNKQNIHEIRIESGSLNKGDHVTLEVDKESRRGIIKNHTATHLLHRALKDVLGDHVNQAGSLVEPNRLRFDFSHFGQITEAELSKMEHIVNRKIWDQLAVDIKEMPIKEAKELGAMALFGEKYGDVVRVVRIGNYSIELCGGIHVKNTAEIGLFNIISESGIGAGTRRIEAVTGESAYRFLNQQEHYLKETANLLKTTPKESPQKVEQLHQEVRELKRENESLLAKLANAASADIFSNPEDVGGVPVIAKQVNAKDMNQLRQYMDNWKETKASGILVLGAAHDDKVSLISAVSEDLIKEGYHAGKLLKEVATRCGGNGGGRPDTAQAGGKDPEKLASALAYVTEWVAAQQ